MKAFFIQDEGKVSRQGIPKIRSRYLNISLLERLTTVDMLFDEGQGLHSLLHSSNQSSPGLLLSYKGIVILPVLEPTNCRPAGFGLCSRCFMNKVLRHPSQSTLLFSTSWILPLHRNHLQSMAGNMSFIGTGSSCPLPFLSKSNYTSNQGCMW